MHLLTVSARQADYADADGHRKVGDYRKGIEDLENAAQEGEAEQDPEGGKQTGKPKTAPGEAGEDETDESTGKDIQEEAEE